MNIDLVWNEYRSLLKQFIASKVSNPTDAEDLLQTILLKVHQNLSNLRDETKIKSWLLQLSNNTIIDFYRSRAKRKELQAEDLWFEHEQQNATELIQCIKPFINELPDKYRDLLLDVELAGTSQKDYAERHNISYSTFKSRVQKGRKELKRIFDRCCDFELDKNGKAVDWQKKGANLCKNC